MSQLPPERLETQPPDWLLRELRASAGTDVETYMERDRQARQSEPEPVDAKPQPALEVTSFMPLDVKWECQDDPDKFFPDRKLLGKTAYNKTIEQAKAICARCAGKIGCQLFALENQQDFGVWGGLSEEERQRFRNPKR